MEYLVESFSIHTSDLDMTKYLNRQAQQGWRVVSVVKSGYLLVFYERALKDPSHG